MVWSMSSFNGYHWDGYVGGKSLKVVDVNWLLKVATFRQIWLLKFFWLSDRLLERQLNSSSLRRLSQINCFGSLGASLRFFFVKTNNWTFVEWWQGIPLDVHSARQSKPRFGFFLLLVVKILTFFDFIRKYELDEYIMVEFKDIPSDSFETTIKESFSILISILLCGMTLFTSFLGERCKNNFFAEIYWFDHYQNK